MRLLYLAIIGSLLSSPGFAIRRASAPTHQTCSKQLASYFSPATNVQSGIFPSEVFAQCPSAPFSYACGVVPQGQATFVIEGDSTGEGAVDIKELELAVDPQRRKAGEPFVGIRWGSQVSWLEAPTDLYAPLTKFIHRGSYIAYTIPVVAFDHVYFRDNSLVPVPETPGFVAKEFLFTRFESLLQNIDLNARVEALPDPRLRREILRNLNPRTREVERKGTYVNADFHVTYQVFLNPTRSSIDVAGLPLRYHWDVATDGTGIVRDVEVFAFPETKGLQYDAVIFFQTAAILRQFKVSKPAEFENLFRFVVQD